MTSLQLQASRRRRSRAIGARASILAVVLLVVLVVTMLTGQYALSPLEVAEVLLGRGGAADQLVVLQFRLPRTLAACLVGAALGIAGAIFQSLSRNPLGSPDIVGFTTGSATGALAAIVAGQGDGALLVASVAGGLAAAALVILFATRSGLAGQRLILAGIAIGATLGAVNDFFVTTADLDVAQRAKVWLFGSLNLTTWSDTVIIAACVALAIPVLVLARRWLGILELGDDAAVALGVRTGRARLALLGVGVLLTGAAIAAAGPIGFVALAAPQLARRVLGVPAASVAGAGLVGALLLLLADLGAQRLLSPFQIPVGLITGALGGAYLLWLLVHQRRRASRR